MKEFKPKFVGASAIAKEAGLVAGAVGTWKNRVQTVALSALYHAKVHKDWTPAANLVDGISKADGANKSKLKQWFEFSLNAEYDRKDNKFKIADGFDLNDIHMGQAQAVKWFNFKPDTVKAADTVESAIEAFNKRLDKIQKNGHADAAMVAALKLAVGDAYVESHFDDSPAPQQVEAFEKPVAPVTIPATDASIDDLVAHFA